MDARTDDSEILVDEQAGALRFVFPVVDDEKHVVIIEIVQDDGGDRATAEMWESIGLPKAGSIASQISGKWAYNRGWQLAPHRTDLGEESGQLAATLAAVAADRHISHGRWGHSNVVWASGAFNDDGSLRTEMADESEVLAKIAAFHGQQESQVFFLPRTWAMATRSRHGLEVYTLESYRKLATDGQALTADRRLLIGIESHDAADAVRTILGVDIATSRPSDELLPASQSSPGFFEFLKANALKSATCALGCFALGIWVVSAGELVHAYSRASCERLLEGLSDDEPAWVEQTALAYPQRRFVGDDRARTCFRAALENGRSPEHLLFGVTGLTALDEKLSEDDYLLTLHSVSVIAGNYADAAIAQAAWNSATLSGSSLLPLEPAAKRLKELDRWLARLPSALRRDQSKGDSNTHSKYLFPSVWMPGGRLAAWQWLEQCGSGPGLTSAHILRKWFAGFLSVSAVWLIADESCPRRIDAFLGCGEEKIMPWKEENDKRCETLPAGVDTNLGFSFEQNRVRELKGHCLHPPNVLNGVCAY